MAERWTVLLLAGSRPGGDPLTRSLGVDYKPLLPIKGEPMLLRPLRAVLEVEAVTGVRVLTQQVERIAAVLPGDPRVTIEKSEDTIAASLQRICADPATRFPLLVTAADHALLIGLGAVLVVGAEHDLAIAVHVDRVLAFVLNANDPLQH